MENNNAAPNGGYNAKLISDLLLAAKGPHRTGVEFCQECNISTPTFSRYVNMHNKRPCPVEFLKKIAEHADPNSKVTLDQLIAANGSNNTDDNSCIPDLTPNELIGILTTTLLLNKYEFQTSSPMQTQDIMGLTYRPSWSIIATSADKCTKEKWDFIFWKQLVEPDTEKECFIRQLLIIIGAVTSGYITFDKLTFVLSNAQLYQEILEQTKDLKLDICVSFLLVDPFSKNIQEEHNVPCTRSLSTLGMTSTDNSTFPTQSSLLSADEHNIM